MYQEKIVLCGASSYEENIILMKIFKLFRRRFKRSLRSCVCSLCQRWEVF